VSRVRTLPAKTAKFRWTRFGWQGIWFDVPRDWSLGGVDGDERKGYVRLEDEAISRVEVRWETVRGPWSAERAVDGVLQMLQRAARKQKFEFRSKRRVKLIEPNDERDFECFDWVGDYHAHNLLTRCKQCNRVILLRVLARRDENMRPVAQRIFQTLHDHAEDGWRLWSVYGLRCRVPERFRLDHPDLAAGRIVLAFAARGETLRAGRFGLVEMVLKERSLDQWYRDEYRKRLRNIRAEAALRSFMGHEAVEFVGSERKPLRLPAFLCRPPGFRCRVWHCEPSDKLLVAEEMSKKLNTDEGEEEFERFAASFRCHAGSGQEAGEPEA